jgi:hypothetical protein
MKDKPNRLGMYADVREILDAALAAGGGEVELPTHGEAIHWRQRAYKFRKMYAELVEINSPYDQLSFRDPGAGAVIQIVAAGKAVKFRPAQGETPLASAPEINDPLFDIAKSIADKLEKPDV